MARRPLPRSLALLVVVLVCACSGCNYRFLSWADSRGTADGTVNSAVLSAESRQAATLKPTFTLFPGDLCESGPSDACMRQWIDAVNGGSSPGNGLADLTFPTRGNHDRRGLAEINEHQNPDRIAADIPGLTNFSRFGAELTYGFDILGDHFTAVDLPSGDVSSMSTASINWLDADLTAAEARGISDEFLFWHGPIVCVSTSHTCSPPSALVTVLNRHPRIRAAFFGHEHVNAHAHLSSANVPGLTHPFEEFVTGTAGAPNYTCKSGVVGVDWCVGYDAFDSIDVNADNGQFKVSVFQLGNPTAARVFSY